MRRPQKLALAAIYRSLATEPHNWTFGKYEAECRDMHVWVCNRYYATRFNVGSIATADDCNPFWWINPGNWWRVSLIRAVEDAQMAVQFGVPQSIPEPWVPNSAAEAIARIREQESAVLSATLTDKAAKAFGLGLDEDGMCDDHGRFGCKRCVGSLEAHTGKE